MCAAEVVRADVDCSVTIDFFNNYIFFIVFTIQQRHIHTDLFIPVLPSWHYIVFFVFVFSALVY